MKISHKYSISQNDYKMFLLLSGSLGKNEKSHLLPKIEIDFRSTYLISGFIYTVNGFHIYEQHLVGVANSRIMDAHYKTLYSNACILIYFVNSCNM